MARVSESGIKDIFTFIDAGDNSRLQAFLSSRTGAANARNLQNVSAIMYALYRRNHDAVRMLRDKLMSLDIWEAAALGDDRQLRAILQPGVDTNVYSPDGYTPLQLASFFGRPDTVVLLLKAGADPDLLSANAAKTTALHGAAAAGYLEVAQRLIEGGADVHARAGTGFTALDAALKKGDHDLIAFISEAASRPRAPRLEPSLGLASTAAPEPVSAVPSKPVKTTLRATVGAKLGATIGAKTGAKAAPSDPTSSAAPAAESSAPPNAEAAVAPAARIGTKLTAKLSGKVLAAPPESIHDVAPKRKLSTTFRATRERTN